MQNIESRLNELVEFVNARLAEYYAKNLPNIPAEMVEKIRAERLQKRYRLVKYSTASNGHGSLYAFVDFDGNIYKAAGFSAPAKGIRGSIFDNNYSWGKGLGVHGAAYRR